MLFTWDTNNLCIVFRFWHVRGLPSLLFSLALIVLIGIGYEFLRDVTRRYELSVNKRLETAPILGDQVTETTPFVPSGHTQSDASKRAHLIKSALYAVQTLYAFMMMLVFMTYNGWVMVAITIGNFLGYYIFGGASQATKETACH
ncbi:Ctr copper transporter family protein [Xylariales sp. PMI_506]|nr:Ctr copper transporter family protein [Xylariales sp. PMI_506]